jgi:hypothetical protein
MRVNQVREDLTHKVFRDIARPLAAPAVSCDNPFRPGRNSGKLKVPS